MKRRYHKKGSIPYKKVFSTFLGILNKNSATTDIFAVP